MLCYAMLCYAMLCYAMLCYAMLCFDMPPCSPVYYSILACPFHCCIRTCGTEPTLLLGALSSGVSSCSPGVHTLLPALLLLLLLAGGRDHEVVDRLRRGGREIYLVSGCACLAFSLVLISSCTPLPCPAPLCSVFPAGASTHNKAALMTVMFQIDFMYFEGKGRIE